MTERAKAIMQLRRAHIAISAAKKHLRIIGVKPSITKAAETIEDLITDLFKYVIKKCPERPVIEYSEFEDDEEISADPFSCYVIQGCPECPECPD